MATWPATLKHQRASQFKPLSGMRWRRMASGMPNARNLYDTDVWQGQLLVYGDQNDVDTLLAFYEANKSVTWDLNYDGDNQLTLEPALYEAFFLGRPSWDMISDEGEYMTTSAIIAWDPLG